MQRGHLLQIPRSLDGGAGLARVAIRPVGGKVAVRMFVPPTQIGGILLPDRVAADSRPDVGIVIASPTWTQARKGIEIPFPKVGSTVCVWPEDGVWIDKGTLGQGLSADQIRVYGVFAEYFGEPQVCDWWDSILCEVNEKMLIPFGDKVVLRLDPIMESDGGVLIPNGAQTRSGLASVESVGPLVFDVKPGDRVCYSPALLLEHGLGVDWHGHPEQRAICDERAILYVQER